MAKMERVVGVSVILEVADDSFYASFEVMRQLGKRVPKSLEATEPLLLTQTAMLCNV